MDDIFVVSQCNVAQIIAEASRFLCHVFLMGILTNIIDEKDEIFPQALFKTLTITLLAIAAYHICLRKLLEPVIEKMKSICIPNDELTKDKNNNEQDTK